MGFAKNLQAASFRGVPFLVRSESVSRGKKTVVHEYPNMDIRYTEELGKLPPTFNIEAIVHGEDALNQRFRLENALEEEGLGLLVHPIYGRLEVNTLDFSVSSDQTTLGQYSFRIAFSQTRANITPSPSIPTKNAVSQAANTLRSTLNSKIEDIYKVPSNPFNYQAFTDRTTEVLRTVKSTVDLTVALSSIGSATLDRVYRSITNNITSVVSSASDLRDSVSLFYTTALDAAVFTEQLDAAWVNITSSPIIPPGNTTTTNQIEREQNNGMIEEHMRLTALTNAYETKAYTDFTTDVELVGARKFLDTNYRLLLNEDNVEIESAGLEAIAGDPDVRDQFAALRTIARKVFDDKEKTVFRIVEIDPGKTSMALTSYRYYGNLDFISELVSLNPEVNHANFNTAIKALTS